MDSEVDFEMDSEMNRDNDVEKFWNCIERRMAIIFPQYLRNILKFLGYDSAATVRAITQEDIDEKFEKFAKTKMVPYVPAEAKQEDYFYYFRKPELFYIIPGHKILLKQVVECTRKMTDKYGIDYFNFYRSMEPVDGPTSHVKPIRKRNLASQKSRQYRTATVTTEDQLNPNTEQANLFEKIEVWLEKYKESSTSIKYTHKLSLASIEMVEETDENNIVKIVAMVPCPICGIKKRVTQVFTESSSAYMSLSNYQRHVRSHNGKDKEQEEIKASSKRRNESDQESELKMSRKKRNVCTTGKGNQVVGAATDKESEHETVLSTKSKNNENTYNTSNESDDSQNKQEVRTVKADIHQNPEKVKTQIPKKQDVRSAVLSNNSINQINESDSTSSSDSEGSQNKQEIREVDAYERDQKRQSYGRNSSDSDSSASENENLGNQNKAFSTKNGKRENPEPGKKKYRKRSNMRSNFLITEAEESKNNRAETKTKDAKKKSKKPFNRFV